MDFQTKVRSAIYASVIGDALGVPVESRSRKELTLRAVKSMLGYGRYNLPAGTWSDDSSMILCTLEALCSGYEIEALGRIFHRWLYEGEWTPYGCAFDVGLTTYMAIDAIRPDGSGTRSAGRLSEDDNGNGSLMRMLPAAVWFHGLETESFLARIHEISAVTHAHPRTLVGCGMYSLLVRELLFTDNKQAAVRAAVKEAMAFYGSYQGFKNELKHFARVLSCAIDRLEEADINSSGYIVDTLEASIWCLLRHDDARSIIIAAVNLGIDTDTTGSIAGGLAGLVYGTESIPEEWLATLARREDIDGLVNRFVPLVPTVREAAGRQEN